MMKIAHVGGLTLAVSALFAGCSSTPPAAPQAAAPTVAPAPVAAAAPAPAPVAPANAGAAAPVAASMVATTTLPPHLDPKNPIAAERSVYFDFDDFTLSSEYAALVDRHGKYLASKPQLTVKIEGNADERGSAEYNLALGQRRAESVLRALRIYGVKDSQVEAVSWGEERPKATGHDAAAWAENRRADLVYPRQ
jgi:peptidoglycan-associated lipoprotein